MMIEKEAATSNNSVAFGSTQWLADGIALEEAQ
jgi:hypothetical protein